MLSGGQHHHQIGIHHKTHTAETKRRHQKHIAQPTCHIVMFSTRSTESTETFAAFLNDFLNAVTTSDFSSEFETFSSCGFVWLLSASQARGGAGAPIPSLPRASAIFSYSSSAGCYPLQLSPTCDKHRREGVSMLPAQPPKKLFTMSSASAATTSTLGNAKKGGVLATKTVETQGQSSVLAAKAAGTHGKCSVLPSGTSRSSRRSHRPCPLRTHHGTE